MKRILVGLYACAVTTSSTFAAGSEQIRLNQVGYAAGQRKIAVSLDTSSRAELIDSATGNIVLNIDVFPSTNYIFMGRIVDTNCRLLDFSAVETPGTYRIRVGNQLSHPVRIATNPFAPLAKASIKAFWYNRCSYNLPGRYAGPWARNAGHPDNAVVIHPSAASANRKSGTTIKSPGGWYDAGDYGKYVVNSGITTWTLLHLYESNPAYFDTLSLMVPTRSEIRSDLLDEILWNLRWMLSMQDPSDGGVYHKLTTLDFNGNEMPDQDTRTRYVIQKSTAASLDLAAVAAYAGRILRSTPSLKPLADSCVVAALNAWNWARSNPEVIYNQNLLNSQYPDLRVVTGAYNDANVTDELHWAASELFLTTQADSFAVAGMLTTSPFLAKWTVPDWASVRTLGWLSLQANPHRLVGSMEGLGPRLDSMLLANVQSLKDARRSNGYSLIPTSFGWGSNSAMANSGILMHKAWLISRDTSYRNASLDALDYLMGRNATGYCFITGQGYRSPMHPHHRPSIADDAKPPVPGFLVGGPNSSAPGQDKQEYPSVLGPKVYVDVEESYASNEVAINWNAPLAYLTGVWSAQFDHPATSAIRTRGVNRSVQLNVRTRKENVEAHFTGQDIVKLELLSLDGRIQSEAHGKAPSLTLHNKSQGLFLLRARAADGHSESYRVLIP